MSSSAPYERLFRVLRDNENISLGIRPKNPNANKTIEEHVDNGSYSQSQYISTSASREAAIDFAKKGYNYSPGSRKIAVINTNMMPTSVIYTNLTDPDILYEEIEDDRAQNFARKFEEVVIEGLIPAHCIERTFIV
ncbi:uncharacterized protein LOC132751916 [Ruditapes philippinarum]|uniref:uncharacterized protein LOC132751916 n=1 Tax=Ruditapes philippinarum TaxID=129788 RepID=UPI00295BF5A3|nr:uncharacterized protein LOC132751916 [Ruditapes philippinarum]